MTNRESSLKSNRVQVWCGGCDLTHVGQTGKCPICGRRMNPKKIKLKIY